MNILNFTFNLCDTSVLVYGIKMFFINMCTYYTFLRLINIKNFINTKLLLISFFTILITSICVMIKYTSNSLISILCLVLLLTSLYSLVLKYKFEHSILITIISLSINYILFFIAIITNFICNLILAIQNDYLNVFLMISIHTVFLYSVFKIRKFKSGFTFLNKKFNEYFDILILNISVAILFSFIMLSNFDIVFTASLLFGFIAFAIIMFITIQKTLTMYYKHKLLENELNEAKPEIKKKDKEIADLETENLNFSEMSHSISHKQKSLEYKLNQLLLKSEISSELDISNRLNKISNDFFGSTTNVELAKTGIEQLDDMFTYMQSECIKNNIDFELQLSGNIHHMTNNFIDKDDLEVLIADHIKNAIIAINYSDNVNRSILVRLGIIDRYYSLYVYDSGIEFEINTLLNLGEKPSTTHKDDGGTGIGFMKTFDTLKKYKASILINENNPPCKENYTKFIVIKFDKKNEYRICSYRSEKIKSENHRENLIIRKFV